MPNREASPEHIEQYLLFDPTEYIKGIHYIGTIAMSELIIYQDEVQELLQQEDGSSDHLPRLFEV